MPGLSWIRKTVLFCLVSLVLGVVSLCARPVFAEPGDAVDEVLIAERSGDFSGAVDSDDAFGWSVAPIPDLDGDGVAELAVGATGDDDGPDDDAGAVWILFLNDEGRVKHHRKISPGVSGFNGSLNDFDEFGASLAVVGDLDNDGVPELAVGAPFDDDGSGDDLGAVWILFLNSDGTVDREQKISAREGSFAGDLDDFDLFGDSLEAIGDIDGDGVEDLAVGAPNDDDGNGDNTGAVWLLSLEVDGTVKAESKISKEAGGFDGNAGPADRFGAALAAPGDIDGDGTNDLVVGAPFDDDGGTDVGAVWILFLDTDGGVREYTKISDASGPEGGNRNVADRFGFSVTGIGDLNGDLIPDIAVGAPNDDDGGTDNGAVWTLFLNRDGTAKGFAKISERFGGFSGEIFPADHFGTSVVNAGDLDGDGISDLFVGAPDTDIGGTDAGAAWVVFSDGIPSTCADANADQQISASDALVALQSSVGSTSCERCRCDIDGTAGVTATDALQILRIAVGLIDDDSVLPLACPICS